MPQTTTFPNMEIPQGQLAPREYGAVSSRLEQTGGICEVNFCKAELGAPKKTAGLDRNAIL
ncbi:MAG: hypothetical protein ACO331_11035 [Prochlorothrix sp.]